MTSRVYVLEPSRARDRRLEWRFYSSSGSLEAAERVARSLEKHGVRARVEPPGAYQRNPQARKWHGAGGFRWAAEAPHGLLVQRRDDWGRWIDHVVWDPHLLGWIDAYDLRREVTDPFASRNLYVLRAAARKVPGWSASAVRGWEAF